MKISQAQQIFIDKGVIVSEIDPCGVRCPSCGRHRVYVYSDGSKICGKCDELIFAGSALSTLDGGRFLIVIRAWPGFELGDVVKVLAEHVFGDRKTFDVEHMVSRSTCANVADEFFCAPTW